MLDPLTVVELLNVAKIEAAEFASSSLVRALGVSEHPWVLKSLHSSESSIWRADQFADEVLCLVVNVIPLLTIEVELACGHRLKNLVVVIAKERRVPTEQDIEHAAC